MGVELVSNAFQHRDVRLIQILILDSLIALIAFGEINVG